MTFTVRHGFSMAHRNRWFTWVYLGLPGFTWVYLGLPGFTWVYLGLPGFTYYMVIFHGYVSHKQMVFFSSLDWCKGKSETMVFTMKYGGVNVQFPLKWMMDLSNKYETYWKMWWSLGLSLDLCALWICNVTNLIWFACVSKVGIPFGSAG